MDPLQIPAPEPEIPESLLHEPRTNKEFWEDVWGAWHLPTLDDTRDTRILAAYFLLRYMAESRGALRVDQPLVEIDDSALESSFTLVGDYSSKKIKPTTLRLIGRGLSLLPPDFTDSEDAITRFVKYIGIVSKECGLTRNKKANQGLALFLDHETLKEMWPDIVDLVNFEEELIDHTRGALLEKTSLQVMVDLKKNLGVNEKTALNIITLVMMRLTEATRLDQRAAVKSRVLARLEQSAHDARLAFDHRGAAIIEREFWRVYRDEGGGVEDDDFGDMTDTIKQGANKRRNTDNDEDD